MFGSVAEAVLLDGELSETHGDVDVAIPRTELGLRQGQLAVLGFDAFNVYYEPRPGLPLVYGSARGDLALELSLVDFDPAGIPFFAVRTNGRAVAISLPADLFLWPPTVIDQVEIHTLSPLARSRASRRGRYQRLRPGASGQGRRPASADDRHVLPQRRPRAAPTHDYADRRRRVAAHTTARVMLTPEPRSDLGGNVTAMSWRSSHHACRRTSSAPR